MSAEPAIPPGVRALACAPGNAGTAAVAQALPVAAADPDAVAALARDWAADLVVVGTRGHGLVKRLLLGSTARSVLHHVDASVLITRSTVVPVPPREPARVPMAATPALAG